MFGLEEYFSKRESEGKEGLFSNLLSSPILSSITGNKKQKNAPIKRQQDQEVEDTQTSRKDKKDPQFTNIGPRNSQNLRVNDTEADVIAKMYNFLQRKQDFERKKHKDLEKYQKQKNLDKEQQKEDIIASLLGETPRKIKGAQGNLKIDSNLKTEKEKKKKGMSLLKMGALGALAVGGVFAADKAAAAIKKFEMPSIDIDSVLKGEKPKGKISEDPARKSAETYLGRAMTDKEWDLLLRATGAEASANKEEQAVVAASILNRVRKAGTDVETELAKPFQFESYTGEKGRGYNPSKAFAAGPSESRKASIMESMLELPRVSYEQTHFQSAIPEAYKTPEIGRQKIEQKTKEGFVPVGKSIANVGIDRDASGRMTAMADTRTKHKQEVSQTEYVDKMNNTWKQTLNILDELEKMIGKMDVVNMNKVVNNNSNISTKYPYINDEPALMQKQ